MNRNFFLFLSCYLLQRFASRRCYSTCSLHGIQHIRHNSCEQSYIQLRFHFVSLRFSSFLVVMLNQTNLTQTKKINMTRRGMLSEGKASCASFYSTRGLKIKENVMGVDARVEWRVRSLKILRKFCIKMIENRNKFHELLNNSIQMSCRTR